MHPLVRILSLIAFAIALQLARWPVLAAMGGVLAILLACRGRGAAISFALLKRARWLMLSILLIYAYATPGEFVLGLPDWIAPTYEGLQTGAMQMARLAVMLAALSLLLATSRREDIMVGVYLLLQPLRILGFDPVRFSARLWLTLHYVETMPQGVFHRLRQHGWRLEDILQEETERPDTVEMRFVRFHATDYAVLALLPVLLWWLA